MSKLRRYSVTEKSFIDLMRTPYVDGILKLEDIANTIGTAPSAKRTSLVMLFLQIYQLQDLPIAPRTGRAASTQMEWHLAEATVDTLWERESFPFQGPMTSGVPLGKVAKLVSGTLKDLAEQGTAFAAYLLFRIGSWHSVVPYPDHRPRAKRQVHDVEEVFQLLQYTPELFARMWQSALNYHESPYLTAASILKILRGVRSHQERTILLGYQLQLIDRALQRHHRSPTKQHATSTQPPKKAN